MAGLTDIPPGKWLTTVGEDGAIHIIPTGEDHEFNFGCHCHPVQTSYAAGGVSFKHRSLSC